ncbi:hypothetical protein Smic_25150 [Streptomyces microflavus]|uniref:Uncharacterized protein n=1 Tax=Streptomyces microflavus TaxID=1919 RepID=A0A7J0CNF1_STRMI|nr:hypothetical protein Smic_25150 [Streptomyces microflavus]
MGVLGGAAGGLPVQVEVGAPGEVREEARPFHEGAHPGEDRGSRADGLPEDADLALVGVMSPMSMRRVVVLPAPLGPSSPRTWPFSTRKESSRTAYRSTDFAYFFESPVIWSGTSVSAGSGAGVAVRRRAVISRPAAMTRAAAGRPQVHHGRVAAAVATAGAVGTVSGPSAVTV